MRVYTGVLVDEATKSLLKEIQLKQFFATGTLAREIGISTNTFMRIMKPDKVSLITIRKIRAFLLKYSNTKDIHGID